MGNQAADTKLARQLQKRGVWNSYSSCLREVQQALLQKSIPEVREAIDKGELDPNPLVTASIPSHCVRCDKPFSKGDELCVVTFGHMVYGAEKQVPRPSDSTVLCEDCEDIISDYWPFSGAMATILAGHSGEPK